MNTINFDINNMSTYKKGKEIIGMLDTMTEKSLPVPVYFAMNEKLKKVEFFVDEIKKENAIGFLHKSNTEALAAVDDIITLGCDYKIFLTGHTGNKIHATMEWEEVVKKEVEVNTSHFEDLKNDIVRQGICPKENLDRNIAIMEGNGVKGALIEAILKQYKIPNGGKPAHVAKTDYVDVTPKGEASTVFNRCLLNALMRHPVIYEGDASVGKNVCAENVAMVTNNAYYLMSMSEEMTGDDIYGTKSTDNSAAGKLNTDLAENYFLAQHDGLSHLNYDIGKAAEFEYLKAKSASIAIVQEITPFVEWLQNGGVLVLNEMNMARANFFSSFTNQITDGTGFLEVPGVGRVNVHPDCVLIGTQNADYTGVCDQNMATMTRFGCIQFPYPKSIKRQLKAAVGKGKLADQYFAQLDAYYKVLLSAVHKGQVENSCLNIRGMVRALNAVAVLPGVTTLAEQIKDQVINTCPVDDRNTLVIQLQEIVTL